MHIAKFIFEGLTALFVLFFIASMWETWFTNLNVEDHAGAADWSDIIAWIFGDALILGGFLIFLIVWALIAHFGKQPFWW